MKRFLKIVFHTTALIGLAGVVPSVWAQKSAGAQLKDASEISVENFMRRAEYGAMSISPKGNRLAALVPVKDRDNLVVIDLDKRTRVTITNFTDNDVIDFLWINNDRLFLRVADGRDAAGRVTYRGTYAINVDGSGIRELTNLRGLSPNRTLPNDEKGEMLVTMRLRDRTVADVYKLNTNTAKHELLTFDNPGDTQTWLLDWNEVPRIAITTDPKTSISTVWHRESKDAKWAELFRNPADQAADTINPLSFDLDNKTLFVSSNVGRDKYAIYKYDVANKKLGDLVLEHSLVDLRGGLIFSRGSKKLMGISYSADKFGVAWFDEGMAKLQAQMDATLKSTRNFLSFNVNSDNKRILVSSQSATDPGGRFLYDAEKGSLEELPRSRPWLDGHEFAERKYMPYAARDGLNIPAWVTIPKNNGGKNLPLIVHVHGGPVARSYNELPWSRYSEAPFFASRGYVVLEPEPRISSGFGKKHLTVGYKQWGQAMQDDLTDGINALVKAGIVDKNKVCIYGGSYGGYAALQGVVKDPDLYRCSVPWIAVSDLILLQKDTLSDTNNSRFIPTEFYNRTIGNIDTERDMLAKISPVNHADKIKAPVLLVMGELDVRVPLRHGTSMRDAMKKAGVKHEFVIYEGEAHGFNKQDNIVDFMKRTEKFFAEHLK